MPSIGEYVRWDVPKVCTFCNESSEFEYSPMDMLKMRIKCQGCSRVRTLDPVLTELGEAKAKQDFLATLIANKGITLPAPRYDRSPNVYR